MRSATKKERLVTSAGGVPRDPDSAPGEPAAVSAAAFGDEVLSIDGVNVGFGGRAVLRDVTFRIRRGEFVGLIGSNGAGKTTLLRVILGLQAPASGTVRVAGTDQAGTLVTGQTTGRGSRRRRSVIGYVPQKVTLDPDMPVRARDLVGLGLDGARLGIALPSRHRRALVADMLAAVDAARFADERVGNLSGGELQRVLIAHALISKPDLLLLDEPLAALDIRSEREIVALLARVSRAQGVSVLISAHDMNPLLPVMDRIVYMAAGQAASGPASEVVNSDVLSRLYGQHVDVIELHDRILVVAGHGDVGRPHHEVLKVSGTREGSDGRPGVTGGYPDGRQGGG